MTDEHQEGEEEAARERPSRANGPSPWTDSASFMPKVDTTAAVRKMIGTPLDTSAAIRNIIGVTTPLDTSAAIRNIMGTSSFNSSTVIRAALGPGVARNLAASFALMPPSEVVGIWQEASSAADERPSTEHALEHVQAQFPHLSREAVRWLVIAWATAMVLACTLYLSMEHPKGFDEVWDRLGPPVIIASLANGIFVSNWKRPGDKR